MQKEKFMNNYPCPNVGCRRSFKYGIKISYHSNVFYKTPSEIEKNNKKKQKQTSTCTNTKKINAVVCNMQFEI